MPLDMTKTQMTEVGQRIVELAKQKEELFALEGAPTITVMNLKGHVEGYRTTTGFAGWEFFLKDAYVGKRGELV